MIIQKEKIASKLQKIKSVVPTRTDFESLKGDNMNPILFNNEMIRAILESRKTVTRRIIRPQPPKTGLYFDGLMPLKQASKEGNAIFTRVQNDGFCVWKPPYQIGAVLYVRETWNRYEKRVGKGEDCHLEKFYGYKASPSCSEVYNQPWKPSIHMPKEAARIFLRVTDVRAERLQDITEEQARKEGFISTHEKCGLTKCAKINPASLGNHSCPKNCDCRNARENFLDLWNSTIKKSDIDRFGWSANPWVWVIEFERCEIMKEESENV